MHPRNLFEMENKIRYNITLEVKKMGNLKKTFTFAPKILPYFN